MELIVGLMLLSIIATAAGASLAPMMKAYAKANDIAEWNTLLDTVANQMVSELSEATADMPDLGKPNEITIVKDNLNDVKYTVDTDGVLLRNGKSVFSKSYYKQKSVSFSCDPATGAAGTAYIVSVTVSSDKSGESISRKYAVRPLVLNQYQEKSEI